MSRILPMSVESYNYIFSCNKSALFVQNWQSTIHVYPPPPPTVYKCRLYSQMLGVEKKEKDKKFIWRPTVPPWGLWVKTGGHIFYCKLYIYTLCMHYRHNTDTLQTHWRQTTDTLQTHCRHTADTLQTHYRYTTYTLQTHYRHTTYTITTDTLQTYYIHKHYRHTTDTL